MILLGINGEYTLTWLNLCIKVFLKGNIEMDNEEQISKWIEWEIKNKNYLYGKKVEKKNIQWMLSTHIVNYAGPDLETTQET